MKSPEPGLIWLIYLVCSHLPAHTKSKRLQAEQVTCSRLQDSGQSGSALPHFSFVCTYREPGTGYWRLVAMPPTGSVSMECLAKPGIGLKTVKIRYGSVNIKFTVSVSFFLFFFLFFSFYIRTLSWLQNVMIMHDQSLFQAQLICTKD